MLPYWSLVIVFAFTAHSDAAVFKGRESHRVIHRGVTESEQRNIVDLHNQYRRLIGKHATNMMKVYWDDGIAGQAQIHAEHCVHHHDQLQDRWSNSTPGVYIGQNMCSNSTDWEMCIQSWFREVKNYQYGAGSKTLTWFDVGHFSQVVNWHVSRIGCGYAECLGGHVSKSYVCNYGYGQLYSDIHKSWNKGKSCEDCPDRCSDGLCDCGGKICYNFGSMDLNTCTCTCLSFYSGDRCEKVDCKQQDRPYCQRYTEDDCKNGVNIGAMCPHQCGKC